MKASGNGKVIILTKKKDISTSTIIKWLMYLNVDFIRINEEDELILKYTTLDDVIVELNGNEINLLKASGYLYRRGNFNFHSSEITLPIGQDGVQENMYEYLYQELKTLRKNIHDRMNRLPSSVGDFSKRWVNKLIVLESASDAGLNIPDTIITTAKLDLLKFRKKHSDVITKPIYEIVPMKGAKEGFLKSETQVVSDVLISNLGENFFPSLFQEKIEKEYEVRVFFLEDEFRSMAIFSQLDEQTTIDFRNYNFEKPNRMVPYNLPVEITSKLSSLMKVVGLNYGSIDLIFGEDQKYYFLEVNPVGQFGFVSSACNYGLEFMIAQYFSSRTK